MLVKAAALQTAFTEGIQVPVGYDYITRSWVNHYGCWG